MSTAQAGDTDEGAVPDDRCGYAMTPDRRLGLGAATCCRPAWTDGRCVWHADRAGKPRSALERTPPVPGERLDGAVLTDAELAAAERLQGCVLVDADLDGATLRGADLTAADLRYATLEDADARNAAFVYAELEEAILSNTDLRGASLQEARFYLAVLDARIDRGTTFGNALIYESDLRRETDPAARVELAEAARWTYRELQRLCDRHALTGRSDRYHVREKEMQRRFSWANRSVLRALKLEGSRFVMRYGHSPWRVIGVSAALIVFCAVLYLFVGGIEDTQTGVAVAYRITGDPTDWPPEVLARAFFKSLYFSVVTFGTLGYGDIRPVTGAVRAVAGLESLAGSLLMALLVYVLTR